MPKESEIFKQARKLIQKGIAVVAINRKTNKPDRKDWQHARISKQHVFKEFDVRNNLGVVLGEPSGNLVAVHLHASEACHLGSTFLPDTDMIVGRSGKASFRWFYRAELSAPRTFNDLKGRELITVKTTGSYAKVPPSVNHSKRRLLW